MLTISNAHVVDRLAADLVPAARCKDGDTVRFETRDCYDDVITTPERPLGDRPDGLENPATGPLYVEGAEPGDILKVEILQITTRDYGIMRANLTCGPFAGRMPERKATFFDISDGETVRFDDRLTLPLDTMIGVIGTAPAGGASIDTETPHDSGGNMDCRDITAGSTLYLPVNTPGALLCMGDLHAAMADGEIFICGMETAGTVTVRVSVLKNAVLPTPCLIKGDRFMTIQSAPSLDEAAHKTSNKMLDFLMAATGLDIISAGMLCSLAVHLSVCQIVDPWKTVRGEIKISILEKYNWQKL
jgi:amidase